MRHGPLIFACLALLAAGRLLAESTELVLSPAGGKEDFSPFRLSVGPGGEIFVLDRVHARLHRFSPQDGREMWRADGTEGGEAFLDPAYLSRPDGFFIYLTDRGSRKVWRIDYRGEIRGSLDLPFAADPVFFELAAGHRFVLYDRAGGLVHLLDDSGRSLFSFQPGGPGNAAEPVDMTLDEAGEKIYFLWPGGEVNMADLSGRTISRQELTLQPGENPTRLIVIGQMPVALSSDGRRYLNPDSINLGGSEDAPGDLCDIFAGPEKRLYNLQDNPPRLVISVKERPD